MNTEKKIKHNFFNEGLMVIISSPSGAGKTTLCQRLSSLDKKLSLSISYTTRKKRKKEINGKHYKFISQNKFNLMKQKKLLLESAKVFGNYYGTSFKQINKKIKLRQDILFDIDWQGAKQIRKKFPKHVVDIFIMPPSILELRKRLIKRGQDDINVVEKRMNMALNEMIHFYEYKYILFNKNVFDTSNKIRNIIKLERNLRKNLRKTEKILKKK